jgi:ABC-type transport system substrate-binding protein
MSPAPRALAAFALAGLAACSPVDRAPKFRPAGATEPRAGGTLRFAVTGQVRSLDPTIAYDEVSYYVVRPMFDTLIDFPVDGGPVTPRLAERWTVSPDGLTYAFELRSGLAFSDGAPLTAAHVKYSLERALSTADSPFAAYLRDIAGAVDLIEGKAKDCAGIAAPDARRLVITLARPSPALLGVLAMPFATPQRAEHVARSGDQLRRLPDATGPFMLASWDEGNRITLRRNPHYRGPARAYLDAIAMLENVPRDTQFQMFERGELDSAERISAPDYLFVLGEPAWQPYVHRTLVLNAFGARMNVTVKPFDDGRVRQALNHALDKGHTERLLNGTAVPAHGILPPGMLGHDPQIPPYPRDVARARALLAEAGYPDGLDLEYMIPADEETEKVAASLQSDLADAGVRVRIAVVSWATWQTAVSQEGGPPFSFTSWIADFPDPTNFLDPRFHSRAIQKAGSTNDSFYANPELDALLDAARGELDPEARAALYRRADRILYDDAPWIWDHHRAIVEVLQPYVRGYRPHRIWTRDYTSAWLDVAADGAPVPR